MKKKAKVIDLQSLKHKRLTLDVFDRLEHEQDKAKKEKRAEVERKARNAY